MIIQILQWVEECSEMASSPANSTKEPIQSRHDAVENFISNEDLRNSFKDILTSLSDIERILGGFLPVGTNARDLLSRGNSLSQIQK